MSIKTQYKYIEMVDTETKVMARRKSVVLSAAERKQLEKYVAKFNTITECAESVGIHRNVLDNVILRGSGAPETIEKIRKALS